MNAPQEKIKINELLADLKALNEVSSKTFTELTTGKAASGHTAQLQQSRAAAERSNTLFQRCLEAFERHQQLRQHRDRCLALVQNPWCHNKQMMLAMAEDAETDMAYEALLVQRYAKQSAELVAQQQQQRERQAQQPVSIKLTGQAAMNFLALYASGPLSADVLHSISQGVHQSCFGPAPAPLPHGPLASQAQAVPFQCGTAQSPAPTVAPGQPAASGEPAAPARCGSLPAACAAPQWPVGCVCPCSFPQVG